MGAWQSEKVRFINKGLDILSDTLEIQPGYYRRLTNAESIQEGSISGRNGVSTIPGTGYYTSTIHSIFRVVDGFNLVSTILVGSADKLYASTACILEDGFSGQPLTFSPYRPEKVNFPVIYVGDRNKMRKVYYDSATSSWVAKPMGIEPPPLPIAYNELSSVSTSYTVVCDCVSETEVTTDSFVASHASAAIEAFKPSASSSPGSVASVLTLTSKDYSSPKAVLIKAKGDEVDCASNAGDKSRLEFFMSVDDYSALAGIRVSLFSGQGGHPETKERYVYNMTVPEILKYSSGSSGSINSGQYRTEIKYETVMKEVLGDDGTVSYIDVIEPVEYQTPITIAPGTWAAVSIGKNEFTKEGQDYTYDWSTISYMQVEFITDGSSRPIIVKLYNVTLTHDPGLDSLGLPGYKWVYTYWNDLLGIESNPCEDQPSPANVVNRGMRLSMMPSLDDQVTHVNVYRQGGSLADYHMVDSVGSLSGYSIVGGNTEVSPIELYVESPTSTAPLISGDQILIRNTGSVIPANRDAIEGRHQIVVDPTEYIAPLGIRQTHIYLNGTEAFSTPEFISNGSVESYIYTDFRPDDGIIYAPILERTHDQPVTGYERRVNLIGSSGDLKSGDWTAIDMDVYKGTAEAPFGGTTFALRAPYARPGVLKSNLTADGSEYTFSFYAMRLYGEGAIEMSMDANAVSPIWEKVNLNQSYDGRWGRFSITKRISGIIQPGVRINTQHDRIAVWGFLFEETDPTKIQKLKPYIKTYDSETAIMDGIRMGTPLPVIFGPYMGKYIFGLGDPSSPGTLYWCNPQYPDYWSPLNSIEVTQPNEPLVSGGIFDGKVFIFSTASMYVIYPSMTAESLFQVLPTSVQAGTAHKESIAIGDAIYFANRYGLFATTGGRETSISDESLIRPIFKNRETSPDYQPIDFDYPVKLAFLNPNLYLTYLGALDQRWHLMVYNAIYKRWVSYEFGSRKDLYAYDPEKRSWGTPQSVIKDVSTICPDYSAGKVYLGMGAMVSTAPGVLNFRSAIHGFSRDQFHDYHNWGEVTSTAPVYVDIHTGPMDQDSPRMIKTYGDMFLGVDNDIPVYVSFAFNEDLFASEEKVYPQLQKTAIIPIRSYGDFRHSGINDNTTARFLRAQFNWEQYENRTAILKYGEISFLPQGEEIRSRSTDWDNIGNPLQKYIWGIVVDLDTYGSSINFNVFADGALVRQFQIPAGIGRRSVEASWEVLQAHQVCIMSIDSTGYILYGVQWLAHEEAPCVGRWATYWDVMEAGEGYLYGVDIEGDTKGLDKSITVQVDGGTEIYSGTVNLTGHSVVHVTFPPVKCKTARVISTDDNAGFLYRVQWRAERDAPAVEVWDTNYNNDGNMDDKWISGIYIECDTEGSAKPIEIYVDGALVHSDIVCAAGRRPVNVTFGPVRGVAMRLYSEIVPGRLYEYRWVHEPEPVKLTNFATNWDSLGHPFEKLLKGFALEADTGGKDKTIAVAMNESDELITPEIVINHSGRRIKQYNIDNVRVENVRLVSKDNVLGRLYALQWIFDKEPPMIATWDTSWENDGSLEDKWISGLYLEVDTLGYAKPIDIYVDGVVVHTDIVASNGRQPVKVSFGPVRGVTMRMYSNQIAGRLYEYKWIWSQEPVQLTNFATNWDILEWQHEKLLKGVSIDADTGGKDKQVVVCRNNDDSDYISDVITINHDGRKITTYHIDNKIADCVRLIPLDNVPGRLYSLKFLYDREPPAMQLWQTQESPFEISAYMHIREGYITLKSTTPAKLDLVVDSISYSYIIPSTDGIKRKVRVPFGPHKGLDYKFVFRADVPFKIYKADCFIYAKPWNTSIGYKLYNVPFAGGE